jgi:hypothetical protein
MFEEGTMSEENTLEQEADLDQGTQDTAPEPEKSGSSEELESYSKGVRERINKLTEKYRREQRDKEEAVRLTQQLMQENQNLKTRMQSLDTGYLQEYGARIKTEEEALKRKYKAAWEANDVDAMADIQKQMSRLAVDEQRFTAAKAQAERQRAAPQEQPVQRAAPQPAQQVQADPKAQNWAKKHSWFGNDRLLTAAAFAIHHTLVEDEGFDPQSDEYYTELDRRLQNEFPSKFPTAKSGGSAPVASAGASASRSTAKPGRRTVKLTPSQVAIAKKLGVPLEEYAKYVKE